MLLKTQALVLKTVKYGDSSLILTLYTKSKGIQQYIASGLGKSKSNRTNVLLRPMNILEIVAYDRPDKAINRLKEYQAALVYQNIPFNVWKGTIGLFWLEVLLKTLKESEPNPPLYQFIFDSFLLLDQTQGSIKNLPIIFLISLMRFTGIMPESIEEEPHFFFDLKSGLFCLHQPQHIDYMEPGFARIFNKFLSLEVLHAQQLDTSRTDRQHLLDKILDYFHIHLEGVGVIKGHLVLKEVMK